MLPLARRGDDGVRLCRRLAIEWPAKWHLPVGVVSLRNWNKTSTWLGLHDGEHPVLTCEFDRKR